MKFRRQKRNTYSLGLLTKSDQAMEQGSRVIVDGRRLGHIVSAEEGVEMCDVGVVAE
jgi:hypothetical protein